MLNITELTCRVCLEEQDVLINIYDELEELNTSLSKLLETCANLQINEDDTFPKYLCENCTRELLITSKFREKCDKSKEILCELLENSKNSENIHTNNVNNIIECKAEDLNDNEVEDLIVEEASPVEINEERDLNEDIIAPVGSEVSVSLLRKSCHETVKDMEIEDFKKQNISTEESLKIENNSADIPIVEEELKEEIVKSTSIPWETVLEASSSKSLKRYLIFKCDICGAIFKQALNLQKHMQKSHDLTQYFTCIKCDHWFSLETEFFKHVENCNVLENCTEVSADNKKYKMDNFLTNNLSQDHNRKCVYCEREFATPFALRMHVRTHTGERPFQCKYCTKSFKTQSQLNVHHKRHTGQADFLCTICNKAFYEQSNLTVHMRSHTGERPHVCSVCNKTFTRVFLLQFHMRTHTGEKPYKCNYCDKSFRQHTDLRSHLTIHTGQKQHNCILCGKSYIKRSHLIKHMQKHQLPGQSVEETSEQLEYDNGTEELNTATDNLQCYVQNSDIIYNFNEIIESEDAVSQVNEFSHK
ncbi:uncharacterized protein ACRADG_001070 [Cochliomyia hominivorax]